VNSPPVPMIMEPPTRLGGILRKLGPGLIIAGSIVGSGELIGTTKTGAEAGFWLLWLIIIGCVIKVFAQVELGRFAIVTGQTSMSGLNLVPGPRLVVGRVRANWILWYWLVMFVVSLGQLGGIVGGVGQALAISFPLTETGRRANEILGLEMELTITDARIKLAAGRARQAAASTGAADELHDPRLLQTAAADLRSRLAALGDAPKSYDDKLWAAVIAVATSILLVAGRYRLIQDVATFLVASFTAVTVVNLVALQSFADWAVTWNDLAQGLSFRLTPADEARGPSPLATALATFGIIGVGANELISYPYWCLEKGYARYTGPRDGTSAWAARARGWMRVLRTDAWCSMAVYTFATIAFYLLGAAVLGRIGVVPKGFDLIRTLSVMYQPVFGLWANVLFLFGAFAVLYSTFFVANAGHARVFSDGLAVMGFIGRDETTRLRWIKGLSGLLPLICLAVYLVYDEPVVLVLASGLMQAMMLPMLAAAALYFRYRHSDERVAPGRFWDFWLWLSAIGMIVAGVCAGVTDVLKRL
jgi:Mn2+/Fe2+ NRAMP family transporter